MNCIVKRASPDASNPLSWKVVVQNKQMPWAVLKTFLFSKKHRYVYLVIALNC